MRETMSASDVLPFVEDMLAAERFCWRAKQGVKSKMRLFGHFDQGFFDDFNRRNTLFSEVCIQLTDSVARDIDAMHDYSEDFDYVQNLMSDMECYWKSLRSLYYRMGQWRSMPEDQALNMAHQQAQAILSAYDQLNNSRNAFSEKGEVLRKLTSELSYQVVQYSSDFRKITFSIVKIVALAPVPPQRSSISEIQMHSAFKRYLGDL